MTETSVIQEWKRGKKLSKFFYLHKMHWGLPSSPAFFECSLKEEMIRKETLLALSPNCALSLTTSIAPLLVWTTVIPHLDHCTGLWLVFLGPPLPYFRSIGNRAAKVNQIPSLIRASHGIFSLKGKDDVFTMTSKALPTQPSRSSVTSSFPLLLFSLLLVPPHWPFCISSKGLGLLIPLPGQSLRYRPYFLWVFAPMSYTYWGLSGSPKLIATFSSSQIPSTPLSFPLFAYFPHT